MTIDTSFIRKRIEKFDHIYALFSPYTHLPFIECDEETFDDQIYVFTTKEMTQTFAKNYSVRKISLQAVQIPQKMIPSFFMSLYQYGVTSVMLQEEGAPIRVPIAVLAEKPNLEKLKGDKVPMANPELELTAIYFVQELHRKVERDAEEKKRLRDMEEEMAHNLFRSRFIIAFDMNGVNGNATNAAAQGRLMMIKLENGKSMLPVFTEMGEFRRFMTKQKQVKPQTKMRLVPVPYDKLKTFLPKEVDGFAINPAGFNLMLPAQQMDRLKKMYGENSDV